MRRSSSQRPSASMEAFACFSWLISSSKLDTVWKTGSCIVSVTRAYCFQPRTVRKSVRLAQTLQLQSSEVALRDFAAVSFSVVSGKSRFTLLLVRILPCFSCILHWSRHFCKQSQLLVSVLVFRALELAVTWIHKLLLSQNLLFTWTTVVSVACEMTSLICLRDTKGLSSRKTSPVMSCHVSVN